jgi:hypothetical protein
VRDIERRLSLLEERRTKIDRRAVVVLATDGTGRFLGMNVAFELDGRFFMSPGLGLAASKHSTRIVLHLQKLREVIRNLSNAVQTNSLPQHLMQQLSQNLALPVRLGVHFEKGQFVLYDKSRSLDLMFMPFLE